MALAFSRGAYRNRHHHVRVLDKQPDLPWHTAYRLRVPVVDFISSLDFSNNGQMLCVVSSVADDDEDRIGVFRLLDGMVPVTSTMLSSTIDNLVWTSDDTCVVFMDDSNDVGLIRMNDADGNVEWRHWNALCVTAGKPAAVLSDDGSADILAANGTTLKSRSFVPPDPLGKPIMQALLSPDGRAAVLNMREGDACIVALRAA